MLLITALTLLTDSADAGTFLPEDPNKTSIGMCDHDLAKTMLEKSRCKTKDAIFMALVWLTPSTRYEINDATRRCNESDRKDCDELARGMDRLTRTLQQLDAAYADHPSSDPKWLDAVRNEVGPDPTRYGSEIERYRSTKRELPAEPVQPPRARSLRTLASVSPRIAGCLSDVNAAMEGTTLILGWQNTCQAATSFTIFVVIDLFDARQQLISSFPTEQMGILFAMAGRMPDGPLAAGTTTIRPSGRRITPTPQLVTSTRFPLHSALSEAAANSIVGARITFRGD